MCTGTEIMMGASLLFGAYATYSASHQQAAPQVVQQNPVADDTAAQAKAAQDAAFEKLQLRERARHNSLLSAAGGAGDQSTANLGKPAATGKTTTGE
jgi:hypothetical protein